MSFSPYNCCWPNKLHLPQEQCYALATTDAGTAYGPTCAPSPHLVHQVGGDARTRGACTVVEQEHTYIASTKRRVPLCKTELTQRVTKSDCPSIDIGPVWIKLQLLGHCQALCSKGLVHLSTQGSCKEVLIRYIYVVCWSSTDLPPRRPLE